MMQKHSVYLDKKKDFIKKNDSLSPELFDFYKQVYIAQEKFSDSLSDNVTASFKIDAGSAPFLKTDKIELSSGLIDELTLLLDSITTAVSALNPGMDFTALKDLFKTSASGILKSVLDHDFDNLEKTSSDARLDIDEFLFVIHNVFKPLIVKLRMIGNPGIEKEDWLKGECPFCGYFADFSKIIELKDNRRKLHCSLCENEWEFPRLKCHACGTDDQDSLGYYEYEDNSEYRIYYCDSCRKYIKSVRIVKLQDEAGYDLTVEDIITGFLDVSMMNKNYNRL